MARVPSVIAVTYDAGDTWRFQACPSELSVTDVAFSNREIGWITGQSGLIFQTVTGGW